MATQLELKRVKLELSTIRYAKDQTEFRIEEFQSNIDALLPTLEGQKAKEAELIQKLKLMEESK